MTNPTNQCASGWAGNSNSRPPTRNIQVTTAGTSGATMPIEAFSSAVFGGTVTDGGVTWTITDPYLALTINYRSTINGL
jgi:hypothetical protein